MSNLVTTRDRIAPHVDVAVRTTGNPHRDHLLTARRIVREVAEVGEVFTAAKAEGLSAADLAARLEPVMGPHLRAEGQDLTQLCTYLADEFAQIGDSVLLIDPSTGRAIARVSDQDFYQPAKVLREDGTLATPAKRLRPELEGFIIQWTFDRSREVETRDRALARLPQTPLLIEKGDRRVLFTTREGRAALARDVAEELPRLLTFWCGGAPRGFLSHVAFEAPEGEGWTELSPTTVSGTSGLSLIDPRTKNLRQDPMTTILATTAAGWVRDLATTLVLHARERETPGPVPLAEVDLWAGDFWVASPNAALALQRSVPGLDLLTIGVSPDMVLGLRGEAVRVVIDEGAYGTEHREVFDRWEVRSVCSMRVWVKWDAVAFAPVSVAPSGQSVEVRSKNH
jgi:hypothetical protein